MKYFLVKQINFKQSWFLYMYITWKTPRASAAMAVCSGVRPVESSALQSAPASSKTLAASARAYLAARCSDVSPIHRKGHLNI